MTNNPNCPRCGSKMHSQGIIRPDNPVSRRHKYKCPKCGRSLLVKEDSNDD